MGAVLCLAHRCVRPAFYRHFAGKAECFAAAYAALVERLEARIEAAMELRQPGALACPKSTDELSKLRQELAVGAVLEVLRQSVLEGATERLAGQAPQLARMLRRSPTPAKLHAVVSSRRPVRRARLDVERSPGRVAVGAR